MDFVVTDPPFFDNVHYSELADFFHAWQVLFPRGFIRPDLATTRHALAEEPIQLDILLVCRKQARDGRPTVLPAVAANAARRAANAKSKRLRGAGFALSANDWRVILASEGLRAFGPVGEYTERRQDMSALLSNLLERSDSGAELEAFTPPEPDVLLEQNQMSLWSEV